MLEFRNLDDFSGATPSSGYYFGYDLDGKLKQKSSTGSIIEIGGSSSVTPGSLTASSLNSTGGATSGYILSVNNDGYFNWIKQLLITGSGIGSIINDNGSVNIASGNYSFSEGKSTISSGSSSHAEGELTTASGQRSHAEGHSTIASGTSSHAEGFSTIASGVRSHAEGVSTIASGIGSHAQGNTTIASGIYSHASGVSSTSSGSMSFVHGNNSNAIGQGTVVLGNNIVGINDNTVYVSTLNVGIVGTSSSVGNIGIDIDGNIVYQNTISISRSDIMLLIASSSLIPGLYYHLNDEADANAAYDGDPSNGAGIIIQAILSDKLSLEGHYIALNADYQSVGTYPSGIQLGVWTSILTPSINDYVIWNNNHWKNLTGTNTVTVPPDDVVNWILATRDISNGYIREIDDCQYDIVNSNNTKRVTMRSDKRGNVVYL